MADTVAASRDERKARRQLGINILSVSRAMRQVKREGYVDMTDKEAVSQEVLALIVEPQLGNPGIDWGSIDWDALFEFIMKIVELFMAFA